MPSGADLRILGVSVPDVSDFRERLPRGRRAQFYAALARRYELVGVIRPELSRLDDHLTLVRAIHPRLSRWRARSGFSKARFLKRTAAVQHELSRFGDSYDLILQMQTLCAPGFDTATVPFAIYVDNTMALTQRFYPPWARLSRSEANQWMQLEAGVSRSASVVFTMSEFARRSMIEDYDCQPDQVVTIGAGVNQFIEELDYTSSATSRALFVGEEFVRKGGQVLLDAWRAVMAEIPAAELIVAGPRRDPRAASHRGVRWVGPVDRDRLASLYRSADVFVMPSIFEPWGHVFLEAMGYGLPCIGTTCCAMAEIIDDGVTGRLVPPGEYEPLAAAIIDLLTRRSQAANMGRIAHTRVLAGHRWSDVVDRVAVQLDARGH